MKKNLRRFAELVSLAAKQKNLESILEDLFTTTEVDDVVERWEIICMLIDGVPQRDIKDKLSVSISKVTRGSHALQNSRGGFDSLSKICRKRK